MSIRTARTDELTLVASLLRRAYEEHLEAFPSPIADAYRRDIGDLTERTAVSTLLVAEQRGAVAGCVTHIHNASDDAHPWPEGGAVLRLLAVDPASRQRGLGTELSRASIRLARKDGRRYLALHTAPSMVAAQRIYRRLGFERTPQWDFDPALHYAGMSSDDRSLWGLAYRMALR